MSSNETKLVLIVDDEPMDINAMRNILEGTGEFATIAATNYDEAMSLFERRGAEVELALIDVALPGKNGVELAKRLITQQPSLRVLFVSGHVGASVIRFYGINAGDEHFLQKPFDQARLLQRVKQAIAAQQPLQFILSASSSGSEEEASSTSGD